MRELYSPFESNLKSVSSDVYLHEMPGGQYTNLKFQATSLGLGAEWSNVCKSYAAANKALGDIVKVTPSSKVGAKGLHCQEAKYRGGKQTKHTFLYTFLSVKCLSTFVMHAL